MHTRSRSILCYLATKAVIEEAMIFICGMNIIEPGEINPLNCIDYKSQLLDLLKTNKNLLKTFHKSQGPTLR
uniref:Uncharacterized protein n=1 Tax=Helianthus annuus TaxID=4232 RepID=A0A251SR22_HELAN